jgi:hypothetical protein
MAAADHLEAGQDPVKTIRNRSPAKAPFLMHLSDRETIFGTWLNLITWKPVRIQLK